MVGGVGEQKRKKWVEGGGVEEEWKRRGDEEWN